MTDHIKDVNEYIDRVVTGDIPACEWVVKACQRHLDDQANPDFKFEFDPEKAKKVCKFIELLPHVKGKWAGQRAKLEMWQKFIIAMVFGWIHKETGFRRFRTVHIEVPRKNGKSFLTSAVALYMLVADGEAGAEVYSAATTRDQARIVFQSAQQMVRKSPHLRAKYGIKVNAHNIHIESTASKFESLSAEGTTLDGLNIHFASNDELHAHKTRVVYDVLETATGSRTQSLLWNITTAGSNMAGICYELRIYLTKILNRAFFDETFFGIIYTIDHPKKGVDGEPDKKGDDWTKPESWKKANPNYGVSVFADDIERLAMKAIQMSSAQNNFLTKRLNEWVNADTAWMNMVSWHKCSDTTLKLEDFEGKPCFIALDLASKIDIASKVYLFPEEEGYALFGKHYLPEDVVNDKEDNSKVSHYAGWAKDGLIELTPGNMIDQNYIKADVLQDAERFDLQELSYDPWQANKLAGELAEELGVNLGDDGCPLVEIRPTVQNFSDPMKMFEAMVLAGKIRHNGCPLMTWMVSNVVGHLDHKDNIYPNKEKPENKIDGVVATLMAMNRANHFLESGGSVYETRGVLTF